MKQLFYLFLLNLLFSCLDKTKNIEAEKMTYLDSAYLELRQYIQTPVATDTICIKELDRAMSDFSEGRIVMNDYIGLERGNRRYYEQLESLAIQSGLTFQPEGEYCVVYFGQTQGCYGIFMDSIIERQFGQNFKRSLHQKADSLFLIAAANDTIRSWYCDIRPTPKNQDKVDPEGIFVKTNLNIESVRREWGNEDKTWFAIDNPFMDIEFTINQDGELSNFTLLNFVPVTDDNAKLQNELFKAGIEEIKERFPKWNPGEIKQTTLDTRYYIRIHFNNEKST